MFCPPGASGGGGGGHRPVPQAPPAADQRAGGEGLPPGGAPAGPALPHAVPGVEPLAPLLPAGAHGGAAAGVLQHAHREGGTGLRLRAEVDTPSSVTGGGGREGGMCRHGAEGNPPPLCPLPRVRKKKIHVYFIFEEQFSDSLENDNDKC